jgi:hypothetical protein
MAWDGNVEDYTRLRKPQTPLQLEAREKLEKLIKKLGNRSLLPCYYNQNDCRWCAGGWAEKFGIAPGVSHMQYIACAINFPPGMFGTQHCVNEVRQQLGMPIREKITSKIWVETARAAMEKYCAV